MTARFIAEHATARGWKVWIYRPGSPHMRIERTDGVVLEIFSSTPPTTSNVAAMRADDKFATHQLLEEHGLPIPFTTFGATEHEVVDAAETLLKQHKRVVIKPYNAGHGHGITVGVADIESVRGAIKFAQRYSAGIIIQEHIERPIDVRILCIDNKFQAALIRLPARVQGDGKQSVRELIRRENKSARRGVSYHAELNKINLQLVKRYVPNLLDSVPLSGEWVQLLGTANVGTGGETIDVTDDIPVWLRQLAEQAARVTELPVGGIDFLLQKRPTVQATPADLAPVIIEVNKCPALYLHETPTSGRPRPAVEAFLDYLASIPASRLQLAK